MKLALVFLFLLSPLMTWAQEDHSEEQLRFYFRQLLKAGGKSKYLHLTRCRVKELEVSFGEAKLLLETSSASFHERAFQTNLRCELNKVEIALTGVMLVSTRQKRSVLKDLTFEHDGERMDFTHLVSEYGYFSLEDQLRGYRSPSP